ncbi:helix-turn-helix transcriptional regulator [Salipiger sp. PrR003]|uniref:helix-turn-helix domain-containing protein n=1 Tax=Salipiger sp. PrR003 TaxID=2706776 RepID=UPI0013DBCCA5|nr:helix-turn-helix transcriptional regulator [Salipiger sp. PrR003]NDV50609.1 helix-turn-helix transcriptional regulator [Salipiger sp. PrR003]
MPNKSFKDEILTLRSDVAASVKENDEKRRLALALRALRKDKGLTQKDVEKRSNLSQPVISKLESPTGALPNWSTVTRYVEACEGHMLVGFSAHKFNEAAFIESQKEDGDTVVAMTI